MNSLKLRNIPLAFFQETSDSARNFHAREMLEAYLILMNKVCRGPGCRLPSRSAAKTEVHREGFWLGCSLGYLPDGTALNRAGNCINHPETIGPDPHTPGSPLPRARFTNSIGYLPDGTPLNKAGNCINHPETIGPDLHTPGSPLPPSHYAADIGYLVDGTDILTAGNNSVRAARIAICGALLK